MKSIIASVLSFCFCVAVYAGTYVDHRGHNVDSLERVVSRWTPQMIDEASDEELASLILNWRELMIGTQQINPVKSEYYARKVLAMALEKGWYKSIYDAAKMIGQGFWANEKYDSAAVYFKMGLNAADRMAEAPVIPMNPDGYDESEVDDARSSLYGAVGNLYSIQDSVETAMYYYGKAGEIFKKHGWLNSCAVLYYNMGETWGAVPDFPKAKECYLESLRYAREAGDSLWIAGALKGMGAMYLSMGKTARALKYLDEADVYYSTHEDEEFMARLETLDYVGQVLTLQKKSLFVAMGSLAAALLLLLGSLYILKRLRQAKQRQAEAEEFIEETIAQTPPSGEVKLNDREISILKMLVEGKESAEMARVLCLSPETIKWYRKRLLAKFDVTSAAALVSEVYKRGILS